MPHFDRDLILRIVLAVGPTGTVNFPTAADRDQIGASEELLAVAAADRREIHDRYVENRGRQVGEHTLSFSAAVVVARVEWIEGLLGAEKGATDA